MPDPELCTCLRVDNSRLLDRSIGETCHAYEYIVIGGRTVCSRSKLCTVNVFGTETHVCGTET